MQTLIVGGGTAGLAAARALKQARRDFLLVTDRLGGRVLTSADGRTNFGASYVTPDYRHMRQFVARGKRVWLRDVFFWDGARFINVFDLRNARRLRALARVHRHVAIFRAHLNKLRRGAIERCQRELLELDPLLHRLVRERASDFVRRNQLEELDEIFINAIVRSTVFVPTSEVNAFYYLAVLAPFLLPIWAADCRHTLTRITQGIEDDLLLDRVQAVEQRRDGGFHAEMEHGCVSARNLIVATPPHNTRSFFPEIDSARQDGVLEIPICTLHVRGERSAFFKPGKTVFLRPGQHDVTVLWPQQSGIEILFAHSEQPDLSSYYDSIQSVERVWWKTAIVLSGARWRSLAPRPNLFTIGDYNICGLEDSYLTGLFAARQIIRRC